MVVISFGDLFLVKCCDLVLLHLKLHHYSTNAFLEHEACNRDISELKWQLKWEKEKLDKLQEKLSDTEVLNRHLHEDITFANKQTPIVKENLDLQRTVINQINTAQAKVDSNLIYSVAMLIKAGNLWL